MNEGYIEISLTDMVKTILKKWKLIVICILLCAFICGLYGAIQAKKEKPATKEQAKALTGSMTQEEIDEVEDAATVINSYREMYRKQKDYNDNSIYQRLNPYSIDTLTLSYYVDNHYKVSYPVIAESNTLVPIIQTYTSLFSEDSFYEELANVSGDGIAPNYMKELITVDGEEKDAGIFTVTIYADSDTMLQSIGEFVKKAVIEKNEEVTKIYGQHDLILSAETISKSLDPLMAETQSKNVERLTLITTSIANEEKRFSGSELVYLKFLVHEELEEETSVVKNIAIGMLVGAVLSVGYLSLKYIFTNCVKTNRDIIRIIDANVIGTTNDDIDFLASKISSIALTSNCQKIAIIADEQSDFLSSLEKKVKPNVVMVTDVLNSKESYENLVSCDAAVFVEKLKISKNKDIIARKVMCDELSIRILGAVLSER